MSIVKDSVEAALDLDEKSVYSHIAHESAEDIIRIISSIDAERARLRGEVIYYTDDWDDLIRQRIAKGKRHTAFDFYNPALLDIWEAKVKKVKTLKKAEKLPMPYMVLSLRSQQAFWCYPGLSSYSQFCQLLRWFFSLDGGLGIEWISATTN